jgi:fructose-specific phosphotransferase system component IIB
MESREGVQQIALIELQRVVAADQEFRRSDDVFAVDNAEKAHLWMADEIIEDSGHHHGVTRVQHIVETNDAVKMQNRVDEFQVVGQASARVVAVDMNEPHGSLAKLVSQVARRDFAAVRLPAKEAVTRDSSDPALRTRFSTRIVPTTNSCTLANHALS